MSQNLAPPEYPSSRSRSPSNPPPSTLNNRPNFVPRQPSVPSIRIRRKPAFQAIPRDGDLDVGGAVNEQTQARQQVQDQHSRFRSISEPQRPAWESGPAQNLAPLRTSNLPVVEEVRSPSQQQPIPDIILPVESHGESTAQTHGLAKPKSTPSLNRFSVHRNSVTRPAYKPSAEYESGLVDFLDAIDPEVATLSTLTNVQNSLFVPDLGRFVNRRPTFTLSRPTYSRTDTGGTVLSTGTNVPPPVPQKDEAKRMPQPPLSRTSTSQTMASITSRVNDDYYAVLPHGVTLMGWSDEEKKELDDHVRHMMHSKRSKFKQSMKGFGKYVSHPLGFFVTLYAVLITLFGFAWVLFLIGWVNLGGRKDYIINIIDNVLVALFAIMGDGLAPFRAVDTYHMIFVAHYHHLTWRLRREKALPDLPNKNDLPLAPGEQPPDQDLENGEFMSPDTEEVSVLTPKQAARLKHHEDKVSKSHTFYKPHETSTHYAFPLHTLVLIQVLLDCHSLLQIALGTCTWAISYHTRPFALTTVILCCSITCNISAGIWITIGDRKTRKKDVIERMERQDMTAEAMRKVERHREKQRQKDIERSETIEEEPSSPSSPSLASPPRQSLSSVVRQSVQSLSSPKRPSMETYPGT